MPPLVRRCCGTRGDAEKYFSGARDHPVHHQRYIFAGCRLSTSLSIPNTNSDSVSPPTRCKIKTYDESAPRTPTQIERKAISNTMSQRRVRQPKASGNNQ